VYRATLHGRNVVLKRWILNRLAARFKARAKAGRADRHWRNAAWLEEQGIGTARCLALATEYRKVWPRRWLVMEAVPGHSVLEHLAANDLDIRAQHILAAELGKQIASLAECDRRNRDHKPSNLMVTWLDEGPWISIIDAVAIQRGADPERMLASLMIEPTGCGLRPRRTLAMRVLQSFLAESASDSSARNRIWHAVADRIAAHGDPRPRVDPLAPPPGSRYASRG
jgi:hypothetical protein